MTKPKQKVHIRYSRKKQGGNQFYRSDSYVGILGTLCGAEMTDKDISFRAVKFKKFNVEDYRKLGMVVCNQCLSKIERG